MSDIKTVKVRNEGDTLAVEYSGSTFYFPPGVTQGVEEGLAKSAQYRYAPQLQIDYRKAVPMPEPTGPAEEPATPAAEPPPAEAKRNKKRGK